MFRKLVAFMRLNFHNYTTLKILIVVLSGVFKLRFL